MVQLHSAREGILCAANFVGEIIAFEFEFIESLLRKEGVLNSHKNLQFWQIAQPLFFSCLSPTLFGIFLADLIHELQTKSPHAAIKSGTGPENFQLENKL